MQPTSTLREMHVQEPKERVFDLAESSVTDIIHLMTSMRDVDNPEAPGLCKLIGDFFWRRYNEEYCATDLDKAILSYDQSVGLTLDFDPEQVRRLVDLGVALLVQFQQDTELPDVERACFCFESSLLIEPPGEQACAIMSYLGGALLSRFRQRGDVGDVERAITVLQQAVHTTLDDDPNKSSYLTNLGLALQMRFACLGCVSDLEATINAHRGALEQSPDSDPGKSSRLNSLGVALLMRFKRLGKVSDLEASIDIQWKVVELTPDGHPEKPGRLNNLGLALQRRFVCLGNISDLDASIDLQRKTLKLTPEGNPFKPGRRNNLGNTLQLRFERLQNVSDLEMSIKTQQKATELTLDVDPDKPGWLNNLNLTLQLRFKHLGNVADLDASIATQRKAVELTPEGRAEKPGWLSNLGLALQQRFVCLGHASDFEEALEALSSSAQSAFGAPSVKLDAAHNWGVLGELTNDGQQTIRAYACSVSLIPQVAWMGLEIDGRHEALASIGELVTKAAAAAVRYGQPHLALEWLEQGRSVVWGQTLQLRSPVDILRERDPVRADRLTEVSRALQDNSKDDTSPAEERSLQLRALSLEWDELLSEVRHMDGFEDFLGPKKVEQFFPAASLGPIVVLNTHKTGCDALVLLEQADEVIHIPLQFTSERAQVLLDSLQMARFGRSIERYTDPIDRHILFKGGVKLDPDERIKSLLAELWNLVVKPILDGLALSVSLTVYIPFCSPSQPRSSHLTARKLTSLASAGVQLALSDSYPFMRLGCMTMRIRGRNYSSFAVSSYTPTVTALLQPPVDNLIPPKILAVSQSQYVGRPVSALPQTKHEIALINRKETATSIDIVAVEDAAGTVKRILEEMTKCSWIHLACHGTQDIQSPTKSALILADGNLELEEIVKLTLPQAEFAFLSACQTATGDAKLAEEAVHLAAGMLLAGYKSVIATMWSIRDQDGPIVADAVYSELLKSGKTDSSRAAHALHKAVQQLRSSGSSFLSWIPFIHMGR